MVAAILALIRQPGRSSMIFAAFIGLELYEGMDQAGTQRALAALEQLAVLIEVVDDLGQVSRRVLKSKINRAIRTS